MLTSSDFLRLPYPPDLSESGVAYALRALAYENILPNRIIRMSAGFAAEIAFRRHLSQNDIPYEVISALPLAERERHDVLLAGRRCDVKSFFISRPAQISALRRDPRILLEAPALVPSDMDAGEGHADGDLYLFAFVAGLKAPATQHCFMHALPRYWREPAHWNPLGEIVLKSESNLRALVEIGGLNHARAYVTRQVELPPRKRVTFEHSFYSISHLRLYTPPAARLGLSLYRQPYVIAPQDWRNLWIDGAEILFAGCLTRGEFRRRARNLPPGANVFQYSRTRVKNLMVPVKTLTPLNRIFDHAIELRRVPPAC